MRVLVTGGSSLIGTGVAEMLAGRGDAVVCFQRHNVDSLAGIEGVSQHLGDIRDSEAVNAAAVGCDAIIHLAARVGVVGSEADFVSTNVGGTRNVVTAAKENQIGRIVHVSSPSVAHGGGAIIGAGAHQPTTGRLRAWYAESKALAEIEALAASSLSLGVVAVRPHLVWGPGDTQLVGRIVERARQGRLALVGGGSALVDSTYIDNAVEALVAAVDRIAPDSNCAGRAYVIANGEPRPVRDLVAGICAAAGVPFEPRDISFQMACAAGSILERVWPQLPPRVRNDSDEPPLTRFVAEQLGTAHWFDPAPAALDLGWTPAVSVDDGFIRLADSY